MKNFNIKRFGFYLKKEVYSFVSQNLAGFAIGTLIMAFLLNILKAYESYGITFASLLVAYPLMAMVCASNSFSQFKQSPNNLFALTNPASHTEKWLAPVLIQLTLVPLFTCLALLAGSLLGSLRHLGSSKYAYYLLTSNPETISRYMPGSNDPKFNWSYSYFLNDGGAMALQAHLFYLALSAFFIWGSLMFGRLALLKTWLFSLIFALVLWAFCSFLDHIMLNNLSLQLQENYGLSIYSFDYLQFLPLTTEQWGFVWNSGAVLLALIFGFLSFLKLKEAEC